MRFPIRRRHLRNPIKMRKFHNLLRLSKRRRRMEPMMRDLMSKMRIRILRPSKRQAKQLRSPSIFELWASKRRSDKSEFEGL